MEASATEDPFHPDLIRPMLRVSRLGNGLQRGVSSAPKGVMILSEIPSRNDEWVAFRVMPIPDVAILWDIEGALAAIFPSFKVGPLHNLYEISGNDRVLFALLPNWPE